MIELETFRVHEGWACRPSGNLGTCGFHPFPWTVAFAKTELGARRLFLDRHKNRIAEAQDRQTPERNIEDGANQPTPERNIG
jgi:hypothetical protein